jgi:hypothetical protein
LDIGASKGFTHPNIFILLIYKFIMNPIIIQPSFIN